jgi:uncharacterized protein (TIGR04255 family)
VSLSVQFERLDTLQVPQIGKLWDLYKDQLPNTEQRTPTDPQIERVGIRSKADATPNLRFFDSPPLPKIWFLDRDNRELVQIQQDRFSRNWRQVTGDEEYPRYETYIRERFIEDYKKFNAFIDNYKLGSLKLNQCEIAYVNHIPANGIWSQHPEIFKVLNFINQPELGHGLKPENARAQLRYLILDNDNSFVGRLYIAAEPAHRTVDDLPLFVLKLVARGRPLGEGLKGVMAFMDLGRKHIVETFDQITKSSMHKEWGKHNV